MFDLEKTIEYIDFANEYDDILKNRIHKAREYHRYIENHYITCITEAFEKKGFLNTHIIHTASTGLLLRVLLKKCEHTETKNIVKYVSSTDEDRIALDGFLRNLMRVYGVTEKYGYLSKRLFLRGVFAQDTVDNDVVPISKENTFEFMGFDTVDGSPIFGFFVSSTLDFKYEPTHCSVPRTIRIVDFLRDGIREIIIPNTNTYSYETGFKAKSDFTVSFLFYSNAIENAITIDTLSGYLKDDCLKYNINVSDFPMKPEKFDNIIYSIVDNIEPLLNQLNKIVNVLVKRSKEVRQDIKDKLTIILAEFLNTGGTARVILTGYPALENIATSLYYKNNEPIVITDTHKKISGYPLGHFPLDAVSYERSEADRIYRTIKMNRFLKAVKDV